MKRSMVRSVWLSGALMFTGAACGQAANSDASSPTSADNMLAQASVAQMSDALSAADSETGSSAESTQGSSNALTLDSTNCVQIVTTPSPLDPNNLPLQFGITWTWTNCGRLGATKTGERSLTVDRDPNAKTSVITHSRNITWVLPNAGNIVLDGNATINSSGVRSDGTVNRTAADAGARHRVKANGSDVYDYNYTLSLTSADTYDSSATLTSRVIGGTGTINHLKAKSVTTVTATGLKYVPTCCYPVGGTLEHSTKEDASGSVTDRKFVFSDTCGDVTLDGTPVTYPACP